MNNKFDYEKYYAQNPKENIPNENISKEPCLKSNVLGEEYVPSLVFDLKGNEKKENICIYVDRVFDGKVCISGALTDSLTIVTTTTIVQSPASYISSSHFINCTDGSNLDIGPGAEFFIEGVESELLKLSIDTIPTANILLNGMQPGSLQYTDDDKFSMTLNSSLPFIPPKYTLKNIGRNVSAVFNNVSSWRYILRHNLRGKVKYQNNLGEFYISVINNSAINGGATFPSTVTIPNKISFAIPELSVPSKTSRLQFYFKGDGRLINPSLSVRYTTNGPVEVVLTSNLVVVPKLILEVIKKTRVLIPATLL